MSKRNLRRAIHESKQKQKYQGNSSSGVCLHHLGVLFRSSARGDAAHAAFHLHRGPLSAGGYRAAAHPNGSEKR